MRGRRGIAVSLAVAAIATIAGFAASSGQSRSQATFTIGWVPPTVAPFETALRKGINLQAKALGMKLVVAGGQFDPNVQIAAVDSLVQRDVDAILIWPLDEKGIQPAFDRARKAKIPIFVIDSPGARATANFQTNDFSAASGLAQYAAAAIAKQGKPCKVAIIQGVPFVPILKARAAGHEAGAKKAACEILDRQVNTNDNPETARAIVTAWKTKFGSKLSGILAVNDPSAMAALSAVSGSFSPVITGFNGDADAIDAVRKGRVGSTAALLSPEIGNGMAYAAYQVLTGKSVPKTVNALYKPVSKETVGTYKAYDARTRAAMGVSFEQKSGKYYLKTELR